MRWLILLSLLAACPPSLRDDDDDAGDDDGDDDVGDDDVSDDDDSWSDDDDLVDDDDTWVDDDAGPCADVGERSAAPDLSLGSAEGTVLVGDLGWDGSGITVLGADGAQTVIPIWGSGPMNWDPMTRGLFGPGRVLLEQAGWDPGPPTAASRR
jgi:hypothetical protein